MMFVLITSSMAGLTFMASSCPLFGQMCLFLCFILISRKAYRRYIPVSKDFCSSLDSSLFVDEVMEKIFILHVFENPNHTRNI